MTRRAAALLLAGGAGSPDRAGSLDGLVAGQADDVRRHAALRRAPVALRQAQGVEVVVVGKDPLVRRPDDVVAVLHALFRRDLGGVGVHLEAPVGLPEEHEDAEGRDEDGVADGVAEHPAVAPGHREDLEDLEDLDDERGVHDHDAAAQDGPRRLEEAGGLLLVALRERPDQGAERREDPGEYQGVEQRRRQQGPDDVGGREVVAVPEGQRGLPDVAGDHVEEGQRLHLLVGVPLQGLCRHPPALGEGEDEHVGDGDLHHREDDRRARQVPLLAAGGVPGAEGHPPGGGLQQANEGQPQDVVVEEHQLLVLHHQQPGPDGEHDGVDDREPAEERHLVVLAAGEEAVGVLHEDAAADRGVRELPAVGEHEHVHAALLQIGPGLLRRLGPELDRVRVCHVPAAGQHDDLVHCLGQARLHVGGGGAKLGGVDDLRQIRREGHDADLDALVVRHVCVLHRGQRGVALEALERQPGRLERSPRVGALLPREDVEELKHVERLVRGKRRVLELVELATGRGAGKRQQRRKDGRAWARHLSPLA
mmetsp:Transcript_46229/g.130731  ORF Transcript_46229/g.130731 Transcript_46229/m.130731 type:complete len:537 (-) Transcript_46229:76-1686(-)